MALALVSQSPTAPPQHRNEAPAGAFVFFAFFAVFVLFLVWVRNKATAQRAVRRIWPDVAARLDLADGGNEVSGTYDGVPLTLRWAPRSSPHTHWSPSFTECSAAIEPPLSLGVETTGAQIVRRETAAIGADAEALTHDSVIAAARKLARLGRARIDGRHIVMHLPGVPTAARAERILVAMAQLAGAFHEARPGREPRPRRRRL
jgi:hypothetical protein